MKRLGGALVSALLVINMVGCAPGPTTQRHYETAGWIGAVGAGVGALMDKDNRWRGAAIGAAAGSLVGYGLAEVNERAAREAAYQRQTVTYHNPTSNQWVQADPVSFDQGYANVRTRTYEGQRLVDEKQQRIPLQ